MSRSRGIIETALLVGNNKFTNRDFADAELSYGIFAGAIFEDCDFTNTLFRSADLNGAVFVRCDLNYCCFDEANVENMSLKECINIDKMNTEPHGYESIADAVIVIREKSKQCKDSEQYFKMYKTIIEQHRTRETLTLEIESRLREKGRIVRDEIEEKSLYQ